MSGPSSILLQDTTGDEYDMTWTVMTAVSLGAGDKIQLDYNPEWMQGFRAGDYYAPVYLRPVSQRALSRFVS